MFGYAGFYVSMKLYYILRVNRKRNLKNMFFGMLPWCKKGDNQYSKLVHPESFSRTNVIYLILALICAFSSVKFFTTKEKTTEVSPSQSRHLNAECSILSFDQHDLWHFSSAFGLFFTFMWLLTLEDNNTVTHWEKIPVFWSRRIKKTSMNWLPICCENILYRKLEQIYYKHIAYR